MNFLCGPNACGLYRYAFSTIIVEPFSSAEITISGDIRITVSDVNILTAFRFQEIFCVADGAPVCHLIRDITNSLHVSVLFRF